MTMVEKVPKIGQQFESLDEAYTFYNEYAREVGFSIRNSSTNLNKNNDIIRKVFVCYKEGNKCQGELRSEKSKRRGTTREGCKAKMVVIRSSSGVGFVVTIFTEEHNHILTTPKKVHLLRSHRSMSKAKKALTQQFSAANVPIHQQISILELDAGGIENIGCTEKDFYNARRDEVRMFVGHDAQILFEYFEAEKEKNAEFYFSIDMDSENKMTRCFWADAECIKAYHAFGDVVVFDTTYNTNRYSMIFAPFVGVNHHAQTTLFACAFLSDETTESFKWLLNQFLTSMAVYPPKMIITDQDPAMTKAIAEVMPNTVHRFCMWHILMKFSEKLDAVKWRDHYQQFHQCIWNSENREEFDVQWAEVVEQSGLSTNEWLKSLYDLRSMWIPAYVNATFSAGMSSSQRSESYVLRSESYVLRRWTKIAKSCVGDTVGERNCDRSIVVKHNTLRRMSTAIIETAIINEDAYQFVFETFESLQCNLKSLSLNDGGQSSTPSMSQRTCLYNDPDKVRAKGCGKRLKGGKEIATKKIRRCHGCGGRAHDKRNCPSLNNIASQSVPSIETFETDEEFSGFTSYMGTTQ